ncbi:hypothetical protein OAH46_00860 [Verrucomicrobia bacterium]|nr:hypothetical protein [Verrucomicrobiota bacterium]
MQWIRTSNPWTPAKIRAGGSGTSLSLVVSSALSHPMPQAFLHTAKAGS